ncbi:MAG: alpha/beta hydrolase-fold protein [Pseudomonadota bacterium]
MRRRQLLALAAALGAASCAQPPVRRAPSAGPTVGVLPTPFTIPGLNRQRTVRLYLPPSYASAPERRYPVIYMHDGQNLFDDATSYAGEWGVDETMDAFARVRGFEAIVVGIDNGAEKRMTELNPCDHPEFGVGEGEAYVSFIVGVLKPYIDTHYRTLPGRASTCVFGSSMGGLISDYAIRRHPGVFGKAGVFSPAYWTAPSFWDYAAAHPLPADARVYLYMGGQEGAQMVSLAQRMEGVLKSQGTPHVFHLVPNGEHNEPTWRGMFPLAVHWLFG